MLKRASQKLLGAVLLGFLAVSIVLVELHFTGLLPNLFTFSDGVDAKLDLNDGKLTLSRWSSSVFMEVGGRQDVPRVTGSVFDGMSLTFSDYEVQVYSLPIDDGGIEYAVILNSNPNKASLDLPFRSANLDFYFQPPLDKELNVSDYDFVNSTHAIKDGQVVVSRPENVVDSYAVYHQSKMNNEYGTGKAFHIYRPQLIDANGAKCWGTLSIADDKMRIGLNQTWLASAEYPVVVDPSFGQTTKGASYEVSATGTDRIYNTRFIGEYGSLDSISVYCGGKSGANNYTTPRECAIYTMSGSTRTLVANTSIIDPTVIGAWNTVLFNGTVYNSSATLIPCRSQWYYLSVWGEEYEYWYDTVTATNLRTIWQGLNYPGTWPTTTSTGTTQNRIYSIYANYTTPLVYTTTFTTSQTSTYNSSTLRYSNTNYGWTYSNASASYADLTGTIGRRRIVGSHYVLRAFMFFDTTPNIIATSTVLSAVLSLNVTTLTSTWANETAAVGVYAPLTGQAHPAGTVTYPEYNYAYYNGGTLLGTNATALVVNIFNDIILDVSAINKTAVTKLIVRTPREYANDTVLGYSMTTNSNEYLVFNMTTATLRVTYTVPTMPTVEDPYTTSPYISTSGNLSATAYADGNLSMIVLEDNYTSGAILQTNVSVTAGTTTVLINFTKTWNSSIVTLKWRIWCNDTFGFIGSTEWQYTKIGPQYPGATVSLPSAGQNVATPVLIGGGANLYAINDYANMSFYAANNLRQIQFVNITTNSSSPTDLRIYEIVGFYANGTKVSPASVTFANYYTSTNAPSLVCDNSNTTYWDVAGSAFQPANLTVDFNGAYTFSKLGVYTPSNVAANITVAYVYASNATGNMTQVGQPPVLGSCDYNSAYPGYLNSSGAARQSNNFSFAPFTLTSSNVWAIDFTMNWSTSNTTWVRVNMYSPLGTYSVDLSPIANSVWTIQTVTLSYAYEPCVDVNTTLISFYSYNSTTVLIDNCSLVVTYNSLNSVDTELNVSTAVASWDRPLDVLSPVMHALVFSYLNLSDGYYWSIAYDETVLTWTDPISTNVQAPSGGTLDPYHFSPSLGLLPNGSLAMFVAHETYLTYYVTVNSTNTESNLTMILSNWGSVQTISDALYSYVYTVSFSDRLLLFTQHGNIETGNMTMFTFNATGRYEQTSMIYTKVGESYIGFYGAPNKINEDKLYFSWIAYGGNHVYSIASSNRGSSWTYMNGTACTFPIESAQAMIVDEDNVWASIVVDEGDHTSVYYNRVNASWWTDPNTNAIHIRYVNGSTIAPNNGITWNSPVNCVDEYGANITGSCNAFYDSSSNKTFLWVQRERFDALTSPYITKYQKTTYNQFFLYLQNTSLLNFMARGTLAFEPSVPYEMVGSVQQREICGYEATGATQFNVTQGTLYLYPYVATETLNVTHVAIRVNATTDCETDYSLGHSRYYFLYDNNMLLMSQGCYGITSSYGTTPINTWENIPLDTTNTTGHTYNTGIVSGQTYWIGIIYNDPVNPGPETCGYYKSASTTKGRLYADMGFQYGIINASNVPALANLTDSSYSEESFTLSIFLTSSKIVLYGVWDTLACQRFNMNRTTIAFNTPLAVEFAAQWLDYRGLDQVWFMENSTGDYSTAEYNDTEGASTFWCNRTYTLTITSGLLIDCVMYATNTLGHQTSVHLYIFTFAVNLVVGWNNLTTISQDVGYTLGQVCANIQYDQLDAEIIVYNNGSEYLHNYGYAANLTVNITAADYSLSIYSLTAGTWYRAYNQFAWKYIQAGAVNPSSSSGFSAGRGFSLSQLVNLFSFQGLAVELKLQSNQVLSLFGNGFANAELKFSSSQLINLFSSNVFGKELQFASGQSVNVFGNVLRSMELLFLPKQSLNVLGNNVVGKELMFTSEGMVNVFGGSGLGKAFGYLSSGLVNGLGNTVFAKELGFRASNLAGLFGGSSLSKELSFVSGSVVNVFSRLSNGVELAFSQGQTFNVFSSVTSNRGLAFLQGQTLTLFPSLGLGKELGFTPSGTLNVLGYIVPLGPRDLTYALSGLLNVFSSNPFTKELGYTSSSQLSMFGGNVFGKELLFQSSGLVTLNWMGSMTKSIPLVVSEFLLSGLNQISGSLDFTKELGFSQSQFVSVFGNGLVGQEHGYFMFQSVNLFSVNTIGKELGFRMSQSLLVFGDMIFARSLQFLVFELGGVVRLYDSMSTVAPPIIVYVSVLDETLLYSFMGVAVVVGIMFTGALVRMKRKREVESVPF